MKKLNLRYRLWPLLVLFYLVCQFSLSAQQDSLELIPLDDTAQTRIYIENNSFSNQEKYKLWKKKKRTAKKSNHNFAPYYFEKQVAQVPESFSAKAKVDLYIRYSIYATNKYILDKALLYTYKAEDIAESADDDILRGKVNHVLGWYYAASCDYERAHRTYDKAIELFKSVQFTQGVRNVMVKKAIAYHLVGKHKEGLKINEKVFELKDRIPSQSDLSLLIKSTFNNGDTTKTSLLLKQYFEKYGKIDNKNEYSFRYNNLKSIEAKIQHNDSLELKCLLQSLSISKEQYQVKENFATLMRLGEFFLERKDLDKAKEYFKKATIVVYKKLMHNRFNEPISLLLEIAELENNVPEQIEYSTLQENYYEEIAQKISVNNIIENNRKAVLIRQKKEIQSQNQQIWILTVLGFMGMGLLLFSFFYFRKYKKIVQDLSNKNRLLDESVNDKQTLLQETHHRVKNNLQIIASLLNLQRKYTKDKKLTNALIDGRNRVKSMALIHQLLYQKKELKGINVRNYVENLMSSLFSSLKADMEHFNFINNVAPLNLHEDTLLAIGLIINEIVTNSIKYAFIGREHGELSITLEKKADRLFLSISDNGNGMPDDFDINDKSSFGYSLITSLSKKLDATITIESDGGTTVNLDIFKFIET